MTPDELRIRCATLDEYSNVKSDNGSLSGGHIDTLIGDHKLYGIRSGIPDYCNSIDAITAAVLRLSEEKRRKWKFRLTEIYYESGAWKTNEDRETWIATASALDRATAFAAIHQ